MLENTTAHPVCHHTAHAVRLAADARADLLVRDILVVLPASSAAQRKAVIGAFSRHVDGATSVVDLVEFMPAKNDNVGTGETALAGMQKAYDRRYTDPAAKRSESD